MSLHSVGVVAGYFYKCGLPKLRKYDTICKYWINLVRNTEKFVIQNGYRQVTRNISSGSHIKSSNFYKNLTNTIDNSSY